MSLFFTRPRESRAIDLVDWIKGADLDGGGRTKSGVTVTPGKAMKVDAMWSSVNLLASTVANLPVDVFRGTGTDKSPVLPAPSLVDSPSLLVEREDWVYQAMVALLLTGNAVGLAVSRDALQRPKAVEWLDPSSVTIEQRSSLRPPTYKQGAETLRAADVVHLRAFCKPGTAIGMSPVEYRAETLGISLAAQSYGAGFYGGGGHPTAVFQNKDKPDVSGEAPTLKERFLALTRGKREPLVVGSSWSYTPVQVSPAEADFVGSMGYSDAQIARMYGPGLAEVLGYQVSGSSLTYSNRVDRSLDLLTYTVMPWVRKFERFWTRSIAQPQTARMNVTALLRADNKTRHEIYQIDRNIGLYSVDELRALEDLSPLPDGQGQNYTPLAFKSGGATASEEPA